MDYVYYLANNIKYFYSSMNSAVLSGAIDVIVVEQLDGTYLSTPFHVRFGKYGVFNYDDKYVDIKINGEEIDLKMKLGENGIAFFVEPNQTGEQLPRHLVTSPLPDNHLSNALAATDSGAPPNGSDVHSKPSTSSSIGGEGPPVRLIKRRHSTANERVYKKRVQKHKRMIQRRDGIYSGSHSDTELTTHRSSQSQHDPEWKWGEFPESRKQKAAKKLQEENAKKKNAYIWSWFRWSRPNNVDVEETNVVAADSTANSSTTTLVEAGECVASSSTPVAGPSKMVREVEKKGLYLEDFENDPTKIAEYFGRRKGTASTSSNVDSGNGVSLASPSSPSALSLNDEPAASSSSSTGMVSSSTTVVMANSGHTTTSATPTPLAPPPLSFDHQRPPRKVRYNSGWSAASSGSDCYWSDDERNSVDLVNAEYKRSLRLTSDQLRSLRLNYGSNEGRFSITTKYQGTAACSCHIYLFKWSDELVISDIDGTITKSDVLGHVLPAIGGTWAHSGVAELYTRIAANGYHIVYLSSRAIGMSTTTKSYLKTLRQGSRTLPDGPVLLSPSSVLMALRKEVIERRPDEFKITCLTDLKNLFPGRQPFFAGLGNRITDVKSYRVVDIPPERILIINPSGVVTLATGTHFTTDYSAMASDGSVDYFFPPLFVSEFTKSLQSVVPYTRPEDRFLVRPTNSWSYDDATNEQHNTAATRLDDDDELAAYMKRCAALKERRERERAAGKK